MSDVAGITSQVATVDYLQLLTAQLRNQDPIDPVDQQGMINDLTQFSQLEGLEKLNDSFDNMLKMQELSQGTSLVGKQVTYENSITGAIKSGVVDEAFSSGDSTRLIVGGESIALNDVRSVTAAAIG